MTPDPDTLPLFSGLEEAELYHRVEDYGFFTLLWEDPDQAHRAAQVQARRRHLQQTLARLPPLDPQIAGLKAELEALPRLSSKLQRAFPLRDLPKVIQALDPNRDTWISQAEFARPSRRIVHLLRLPVHFVDVDTYKAGWQGVPPDRQTSHVLGYCQQDGIPVPSLVIGSGRGLQLKWLLDRPVPRVALPRWNAVQKCLVARLEVFGADPGARDASRVLRLVDTINTRSGERVRVLWVNEPGGVILHYSFEYLAEVLLPKAREGLKKARVISIPRPSLQVLPGGRQGGLRAFSGRQLAWDRLEDLRTLAKLRGWTETGIPHGYRSKYLHWCLNFLALSGAITANQLYREAEALAQEVCPDFSRDKDLRSVFSTLYRKAQAYEAGERIEFGGKTYPPLYTPRNSTLLALFDVQPEELAHLRTILPAQEVLARDATRKKNRRQNAGAMDRATYLAVAEQRREQARQLRAQGLTWAAVGQAMGISATAARLLARR